MAALSALKLVPWHGLLWRGHRSKYPPDDPGGSIRVSGRYNRGLDLHPADQAWAALYTSLELNVCTWELLRHLGALPVSVLAGYKLSQLEAGLSAVLDCRDVAGLGLTFDDLCHDADVSAPQEIAATAIALGAEAVLVPSATRFGDNLVIFPDHYRPGSSLTLVQSVDPPLPGSIP